MTILIEPIELLTKPNHVPNVKQKNDKHAHEIKSVTNNTNANVPRLNEN